MSYPSLMLIAVAACTLFTSGCSEKLPYTVADTALPNLTDTSAKTSPSTVSSQEKAETIVFRPAKLEHFEEYVQWLKNNGWSMMSETQEVTFLRTIMTKDTSRITLDFTPSGGLSITGSKPLDGATSAPAKKAKKPAP